VKGTGARKLEVNETGESTTGMPTNTQRHTYLNALFAHTSADCKAFFKTQRGLDPNTRSWDRNGRWTAGAALYNSGLDLRRSSNRCWSGRSFSFRDNDSVAEDQTLSQRASGFAENRRHSKCKGYRENVRGKKLQEIPGFAQACVSSRLRIRPLEMSPTLARTLLQRVWLWIFRRLWWAARRRCADFWKEERNCCQRLQRSLPRQTPNVIHSLKSG
jgi:hypothetical protein